MILFILRTRYFGNDKLHTTLNHATSVSIASLAKSQSIYYSLIMNKAAFCPHKRSQVLLLGLYTVTIRLVVYYSATEMAPLYKQLLLAIVIYFSPSKTDAQ